MTRRRPRRAAPFPRAAHAGLALFALVAIGCATPTPDNPGLEPSTVELRFPAADYDRVYDAAAHALTDLGFTLDRRDHRFGVLTTQPLRVGTFAEPWLPTDSTVQQALSATGAPQRRVVRIELNPQQPVQTHTATLPAAAPPDTLRPGASFADPAQAAARPRPGTGYRLDITAVIEQLAATTQRPARSTEARRKAATLAAVPAELQRMGINERSYHHAVARDPGLEQRLLDLIVERLEE
ncbi:MAG: hypothetical protein AAF823_08990 [Planctomycetota bacterium]